MPFAAITRKCTIAAAGTTSDSAQINGDRGCFQVPAVYDGVTAQFQGSVDNITFTNIGSAVTVAVSGTYQIPAAVFAFRHTRIVADAQTLAAILTLHFADS